MTLTCCRRGERDGHHGLRRSRADDPRPGTANGPNCETLLAAPDARIPRSVATLEILAVQDRQTYRIARHRLQTARGTDGAVGRPALQSDPWVAADSPCRIGFPLPDTGVDSLRRCQGRMIEVECLCSTGFIAAQHRGWPARQMLRLPEKTGGNNVARRIALFASQFFVSLSAGGAFVVYQLYNPANTWPVSWVAMLQHGMRVLIPLARWRGCEQLKTACARPPADRGTIRGPCR